MKRTTTVAAAALMLLCGATLAEDPPSPFGSIKLHGDHIDVTIAHGRWRIVADFDADGIVGSGDTFALAGGASFSLIEHHTSYDVRCRLSPAPAGLEVVYSFDARSFGGSQTRRTFFLPAQ